MPPRPTPRPYPLLYTLFFTYLDPLICLWGASMDFFTPALVLSSHIPAFAPAAPSAVPDAGHRMILRQRGGAMLNFGLVSAVLLRYTHDRGVWRIVQAADLIVDFAYFWGAFGAMGELGRLSVGSWRAEDWGAVAITGAATVMRVCFLMGVGLSERKAGAKRRE